MRLDGRRSKKLTLAPAAHRSRPPVRRSPDPRDEAGPIAGRPHPSPAPPPPRPAARRPIPPPPETLSGPRLAHSPQQLQPRPERHSPNRVSHSRRSLTNTTRKPNSDIPSPAPIPPRKDFVVQSSLCPALHKAPAQPRFPSSNSRRLQTHATAQHLPACCPSCSVTLTGVLWRVAW